ncbi:hypothetical protein [Imhoffiella purpurea]|uniref:Uncharacterized protein n=1 Tax=Imhoffiella purpurea TaxID=1249627 RepID=W9VXQ5_9GAMM|nr:hypothetical protein [Imhoffiella purpurea]EXJ15200.1 hypothetical protein D779_1498 [Imhoffiella purpurea]
MTKLHLASVIALAAASTTASAWYALPPYAVAPAMTPEQQLEVVEQQKAMMEQQAKAFEQAMEAQRQFAEQQADYFKPFAQNPETLGFPGHPYGAAPAFPEMPPMPELGQYPAFPEMPEMPEFGQYPEMPKAPEFGKAPELPAAVQKRIEEMDAYRAQAKQRMEEKRAAFKQMSEQRRAMHPAPRFDRAPAADSSKG